MLLTRKEKRDLTSTEEHIRERIENTIRSIEVSDITFLDEMYRLTENRMDTMQAFGDIHLEYLDEDVPVKSDHYTDFARAIKEVSELNLKTIPDIYDALKEVSDDVLSTGESITDSITICEQLLSKVEGTLKKKMSLSSIKDEVVVYDSILSDEFMDAGSLGMDYRGGFITLAPESYDRIWYEIKEIKFTKPKGNVSRPDDSNNSLEFFTDGYFNSRTFSANPIFENMLDAATENINDGRLQTSYFAEYNTLLPIESFGMSISVDIHSKVAAQFGSRRVDQVLLYLDPGDKSSVITTSTVVPYLSRLSINSEDRTSEVLDNSIVIKGATVGEYERGFQVRSPAVYPTGSYIVSTPEVEQLTIEVVADTPQEIWYPEKIVKNDTGNIIHKFNYMETLILNGYEPPEGHPDPRDLYTEREITEMFSILNAGHNSYDQPVHLYRFLIGIKDLELIAYTYNTEGTVTSKNLNSHKDKNVASVEIYTSEIVPDNTSIRYFISNDKVVWYEISPLSRAETNGLPTRIVYNGIDIKDGDNHIGITSPDVYMKIIMTGARDQTPRLKSYAVRIKLQ